MNTQVLRLTVYDPTKSLPDRIAELCDVQLIAGFKLASTFIWNDNLFLIFCETWKIVVD